MVNAKDLMLLKERAEQCIKPRRFALIAPEWLLYENPRPRLLFVGNAGGAGDGESGGGEISKDRLIEIGGHREIKEFVRADSVVLVSLCQKRPE